MKVKKLDDTQAKALPAPTDGKPYVIYYDGAPPGFGLQVTRAGRRSWTLDYKVKKLKQRRFVIGAFPTWKTKDAREEASRLSREVDKGKDPFQQEKDAIAAKTMDELIDAYKTEHLPTKRPSSQRNDKAMLEHTIRPAFHNVRVEDLTVSQVQDLYSKLKAKTPIQANRVLSLLSMLFRIAVRKNWRDAASGNWADAKAFTKARETKRERYLDKDEYKRLHKALSAFPGSQSADVIRLLLLTGARRGETLSATWNQFDLDEKTWKKPASATKTKKTHTVPLSGPAVTLLSEMWAVAKKRGATKHDKVFPDTSRGTADSNLDSFWSKVCETAQLKNIRVHDLRHSYASLLVSAGFALPQIGALLGHTNAATTQRYAHMDVKALQDATDKVGANWEAAGDNVVTLDKHRG